VVRNVSFFAWAYPASTTISSSSAGIRTASADSLVHRARRPARAVVWTTGAASADPAASASSSTAAASIASSCSTANAPTIDSSDASVPASESVTRPRDMTRIRSHSPASSEASELATTTAEPASAISRRNR
jgi:hypothetical protein